MPPNRTRPSREPLRVVSEGGRRLRQWWRRLGVSPVSFCLDVPVQLCRCLGVGAAPVQSQPVTEPPESEFLFVSGFCTKSFCCLLFVQLPFYYDGFPVVRGQLLYLVVRQTMEKQEGIMGIISQWRTFAWEHPAKALLLTIIPLAFLMLLGYTFHSAVYDSAMPGALAGTIIALYLALTLFLGLTTPLTVGSGRPCSGLPRRRPCCGLSHLWTTTIP